VAELLIGLMSGTSMDAIDAALVDFSGGRPDIIATHSEPWPQPLREQLQAAIELPDPRMADLSGTDAAAGAAFAAAANQLLASAGVAPGAVRAIGSHGQTVHHAPAAPQPFSLQLGRADIIAARTGIGVVADFRRADIEAGGQGAPLVPAFHRAVFGDIDEPRVVLNIGGIANITILPGDHATPVTGFDTGPGNTLMDLWIARHLGRMPDVDGAWAAGGTVQESLLDRMLADPWFSQPPPKSTGREYFNGDWVERQLAGVVYEPGDVQATLCALTVHSIAAAIRQYAPHTARVLVCGGGVHNTAVRAALATALDPVSVDSTLAYGIDPDWVEAAAFAWLAREHLAGRPGNLPGVTGARRPVVLGTLARAPGHDR